MSVKVIQQIKIQNRRGCNLDYRLGFIYFIISRYYNKLKIKIGGTKLCRQRLTVLEEIISF